MASHSSLFPPLLCPQAVLEYRISSPEHKWRCTYKVRSCRACRARARCGGGPSEDAGHATAFGCRLPQPGPSTGPNKDDPALPELGHGLATLLRAPLVDNRPHTLART